MSKHNRDVSELLYEFKGPKWICAYCGDPADTIDHTTPLWFAHQNHKLTGKYRLFKVAACKDCNARASDIIDRTFFGRRCRIAKSLRKTHRKLLDVPVWAESELNELGYLLRAAVKKFGNKHQAVRRRLLVLESPFTQDGIPDELQQLVRPDDDL